MSRFLKRYPYFSVVALWTVRSFAYLYMYEYHCLILGTKSLNQNLQDHQLHTFGVDIHISFTCTQFAC